MRTGPLVVDLHRRIVTVHGQEVTIGGMSWDVLAYLAAHLDEFCDTAAIHRAVWLGTRPHNKTIGVLVWRLRQRLGPDAGRLLRSGNQRRAGHRLVAVEPTP